MQMYEVTKQRTPDKQRQKEDSKVEKNPSKSRFRGCQGQRSEVCFRMSGGSYNGGTGTKRFASRQLCTVAWLEQPGLQRQGRAHCFEKRTEGGGGISKHKQTHPNKLQESLLDAHIQSVQVQA
jgi:hypothetical protein